MEVEGQHVEEDVPGPSDERKIQERLIMLQMKLEKARKHKEQYIDYIKNKYPNYKMPRIHKERRNDLDFYTINSIDDWKYKHPINSYRSGSYYYSGTKLLEQLETSKYFWDINRFRVNKTNEKRIKNFDNEIGFGGIILHSEMPMAITRIKEVKADLTNLRNYRLNMGSEEYFKQKNYNYAEHMDNSLEWNDNSLNGTSNELLEIRKQIINLNLEVEDNVEKKIEKNINDNKIDMNKIFEENNISYKDDNLKADEESKLIDVKEVEDNNNSKEIKFEDVDAKKKDIDESVVNISKKRTINFGSAPQSTNDNKLSSEQTINKGKNEDKPTTSVDEKLKVLFGNQKKKNNVSNILKTTEPLKNNEEEEFKGVKNNDFLDNLFNKDKKNDKKTNIIFKKNTNDDSDDDFFN
uniref:DUF1604 domain-containing protein n=1 Tax=Parastrongyloides trichosuri TaxID=131310 RepID=A0A0N4Z156_PARTI